MLNVQCCQNTVIRICPRTCTFYSTASLIRNLSLEMPADEKARSVLLLASEIISSNLEAFCVKHLLPPPEKQELS